MSGLSKGLWNGNRPESHKGKYQTAKHDTDSRRLWCHNVSLLPTPTSFNLDDDLTSLINCGSTDRLANSHGFYVIGITDMGSLWP